MLISAESDNALVFSKSSPFGQQAIKRTVISAQDDLLKLGQVSRNSKLAIQFSKSATPAQMRQIAQYGKTALHNPKSAAVLGALMGTGIVAGYILLEDETQAPDLPPSEATPGVKTIPIGTLASNQEILQGLKTYKLPKSTLEAVSKELSLPTPRAQAKTPLKTQAFMLPASSQEARIDEVKFSWADGSHSGPLNILITGQITNQTRTIVKARFFDKDGNPVSSPDPDYKNPEGQLEAERELIGAISSRQFHQFTPQRPLRLSVPDFAFPTTGDNKTIQCRVEVRHKYSGKLLAATAALPIQ